MKVTAVLGVVAALVSLAAATDQSSSNSINPEPLPRAWPCPDDASLQPCECTANDDLDLILDCSRALNNEVLESALQTNFPFTSFKGLTINQIGLETNLSDLKEGIFGSLDFEEITITGTKIANVHEGIFSNSHTTLQYFDLRSNELDNFMFVSIKSFINLATLILDDNIIPTLYPMESESLKKFSISNNNQLQLDVDVFATSPNLVELDLASINLTFIPRHLFQPLRKIKNINLYDNDLKELDEFAVDPTNNTVVYLNLDNNLISKIRSNSIAGLDADSTLLMQNNQVTLLDQYEWQPIFDQLTGSKASLSLAGNPLHCGCDIAWIMLDKDDLYLPIITETTLCEAGDPLIFLDPAVFEALC